MVHCFLCNKNIPVGFKIFMGMDHKYCSEYCRSNSVFYKCKYCNKKFKTYQLNVNCEYCNFLTSKRDYGLYDI